MSSLLMIRGQAIGRRVPLFEGFSIPYPPDLKSDGDQMTLRDLITRIVCSQVRAFRERQASQHFVRVLTARQVADGVRGGKVDMDGRDLRQGVDEDEAVDTALTAFQDGIYLVTIDDEQQDDLDRQVYIRPNTRVTFIRLTLLAGG